MLIYYNFKVIFLTNCFFNSNFLILTSFYTDSDMIRTTEFRLHTNYEGNGD